MTVKTRTPIACIPADRCEKHDEVHKPHEDAVMAICGMCRTDVWISPNGRQRFTDDPDTHVLICLRCAVVQWMDHMTRLPDLNLRVGDRNLDFDFKNLTDEDVMSGLPSWVLPGGTGVPGIKVEVIIAKVGDDEDDDDEEDI